MVYGRFFGGVTIRSESIVKQCACMYWMCVRWCVCVYMYECEWHNILKGWGGFRMFVRCFRIILSRLNSMCSFSRDSITKKQSYILCCLIPANGIKKLKYQFTRRKLKFIWLAYSGVSVYERVCVHVSKRIWLYDWNSSAISFWCNFNVVCSMLNSSDRRNYRNLIWNRRLFLGNAIEMGIM